MDEGVDITVRPDGGISVDRSLPLSYERDYVAYMRSIGREDLLSDAVVWRVDKAETPT